MKRLYESVAAGDIEAVADAWHEEIEFDMPEGVASCGGTHHGPDEIIQGVFAPLKSKWRDVAVEPDPFVDGGDTVVVFGRWNGTAVDTGNSVAFPMAHVFEFEDGRIVEWESYGDTALFTAAIETDPRLPPESDSRQW